MADLAHYKSKSVLMPSFICIDAVQPFIDLGIAIIYYPVTDDFSPDWQALETLVAKDTVANMMVHYFGISQDIEHFRKFSSTHGLRLIEDNSHGYAGQYNQKLLGEWGDFGVASPRKTFPISNGALLYLKRGQVTLQNATIEPMPIYSLLIKDIAARCLDLSLPLKRYFQKRRAPLHFQRQHVGDWLTDISNKEYIDHVNLDEIRRKRSALYRVWYNWSIANITDGFKAIALEHDQFAPMLFPLLLKDAEQRDQWYAFFESRNIAVTILWHEQEPLDTAARKIKERLLCLPINLAFNPAELAAYLQKYCTIAK